VELDSGVRIRCSGHSLRSLTKAVEAAAVCQKGDHSSLDTTQIVKVRFDDGTGELANRVLGGFKVGETVFSIATHVMPPTYGMRGVVTGPGDEEGFVMVRFEDGNGELANMLPTKISRKKPDPCKTCGNKKTAFCDKKHCTLPKNRGWYNICTLPTSHGHRCSMPCPRCAGNHDAFSVGEEVSVSLPRKEEYIICREGTNREQIRRLPLLFKGTVKEQIANGYVVTVYGTSVTFQGGKGSITTQCMAEDVRSATTHFGGMTVKWSDLKKGRPPQCNKCYAFVRDDDTKCPKCGHHGKHWKTELIAPAQAYTRL